MTENHPITPPPELVLQWDREWREQQNAPVIGWSANLLAYITVRAAQWGADKELEACCALLDKFNDGFWCDELRAARRPKPPSLKEQALAALERYESEEWCEEMTFDSSVIRRALEQLDD